MKSVERLDGLLACPVSHEILQFANDQWLAPESGRSYSVLGGVPILRNGPEPTRAPLDHASNPVEAGLWAWMSSHSGRVLFLGAGASDARADNVLEVEYNLFRNTDVVADAHGLPFVDGAFGAVVALNVFEHLADPPVAAAEILRVLRPGGDLMIHTAFVQPLHEPPHHYYNATEFGVRRWFSSFADVNVEVPANFNPAYNLSWILSEAVFAVDSCCDADEAARFGKTTIAEAAAFWRCREVSAFSDALLRLPDEAARRLAGGFQITARKPG